MSTMNQTVLLVPTIRATQQSLPVNGNEAHWANGSKSATCQ